MEEISTDNMTTLVPIQNSLKGRKIRVATSCVPRTESQGHGFMVEQMLLKEVFHLTDEEIKGIPYTAVHDLPAHLNRVDHVDVSIKTTVRQNAVDMGYPLRIYDWIASGKPLHIIVVICTQDDSRNVKNVKTIVELDLTGRLKELFGSVTREEIDALDKCVKAVPQKRKPTDEEYAAMYALQKEMKKKMGALYINIKCDSEQSRIQCAFNKFQTVLKDYSSWIVAQSDTCVFRGGTIAREITSGRRQRNKKAQKATD